MTRQQEHTSSLMITGDHAQLKLPRQGMPMHIKPIRGAMPTLCGNELDGFVMTGDPFDGEQACLIVPLNAECVGSLFDRLVDAFDGKTDRFDLAGAALDAIGITVTPRKAVRIEGAA
jgi:hypothetical protein